MITHFSAGRLAMQRIHATPFDLLIGQLNSHPTARYIRPSQDISLKLNDSPVRKIVKRSNYRFTYTFQSKKNRASVDCESSIEFHGYHYLESLWQVRSFREQPGSIEYQMDGKWHQHFPDTLVTLQNGQLVFVEFKDNDYLVDDVLIARTEILKAALTSHGYQYFVIIRDQMPAIRTANAIELAFHGGSEVTFTIRQQYARLFNSHASIQLHQLESFLQNAYRKKDLLSLIRQGDIWFDWTEKLVRQTTLTGRFAL